jgi:hypothetical protein
MEKREPEFFMFLWNRLSEASQEIVKQQGGEAFKVVRREMNPFELWKAIVVTHCTNLSGGKDMEAYDKVDLFDIFHGLKQLPDEKIWGFKVKYENAQLALRHAGEAPMSELDDAMCFIRKLDPGGILTYS